MSTNLFDFGDEPFDIEDLVVIKNHVLAVGVSFDMGAKLQSMIVAAMQTCFLVISQLIIFIVNMVGS